MAEQEERERNQPGAQEPTIKWEEHTRAAGNREGVSKEEAENTPPGGDARTIYSDDRDPGDAEPDRTQP